MCWVEKLYYGLNCKNPNNIYKQSNKNQYDKNN